MLVMRTLMRGLFNFLFTVLGIFINLRLDARLLATANPAVVAHPEASAILSVVQDNRIWPTGSASVSSSSGRKSLCLVLVVLLPGEENNGTDIYNLKEKERKIQQEHYKYMRNLSMVDISQTLVRGFGLWSNIESSFWSHFILKTDSNRMEIFTCNSKDVWGNKCSKCSLWQWSSKNQEKSGTDLKC